MAIPEHEDPYALFGAWFEEARSSPAIADATAMTLATADAEGLPNARIVLLKGFDARGFSFYTNLTSLKGRELAARPHAALCFYWMPLDKQVRVRGGVEPVTPEEADAYFASRPRQSQIGAWASKQSQDYDGWLTLEKRVAKYVARFGLGTVPRPDFWSGFRVVPERIEFWLKGRFRLHERLEYRREDGGWSRRWLYP